MQSFLPCYRGGHVCEADRRGLCAKPEAGPLLFACRELSSPVVGEDWPQRECSLLFRQLRRRISSAPADFVDDHADHGGGDEQEG
jgi:hypothetical protein